MSELINSENSKNNDKHHKMETSENKIITKMYQQDFDLKYGCNPHQPKVA